MHSRFLIILGALLLAGAAHSAGAWLPVQDRADLTRSAQALDALSATGQAGLAEALEASQVHWALSFVGVDPSDSDAVSTEALRAVDWAELAARLAPLSASAQVALAYCAGRAAFAGPWDQSTLRAIQAAHALSQARKLTPEAAVLAGLTAQLQLSQPAALGGNLAQAAAAFEAAHAEDARGGWNAYFCAEAWRQAGDKAKARRWYDQALAEAPGQPWALRGRKRVR